MKLIIYDAKDLCELETSNLSLKITDTNETLIRHFFW